MSTIIPDSDPIQPSSPEVKQTSAYDSQDDSGDELFDHETIATIPLSQQRSPYNQFEPRSSSPSTYLTQPTQIIRSSKEPPDAKNAVYSSSPPTVQVAATSPVAPQSVTRQAPSLVSGSSFAPPGTVFRQPAVPTTTIPPPSSDDDPAVHYSSPSDDDDLPDVDIQPTIFSNGNRNAASAKSSFGAHLSKFNYNGEGSTTELSTGSNQLPIKRVADDSASAYGSAHRASKQIRQTGPARAQPVQIGDNEMTLEDIADPEARKGIQKMRELLPGKSVAQCQAALQTSHYNYEDAIDKLFDAGPEDGPVDLTVSDEEEPSSHMAKPEPVAKRQVKDQGLSIQNKWSSTQASRRLVQKASTSAPAPVPSSQGQPPRKRLLSRKRQPSSSPVPFDDDEGVKVTKESPVAPISKRASKHEHNRPVPSITVIDSDSDSGLGHDRGGDIDDDNAEGVEKELLKFMNRCTVEELADISNQPEEMAGIVIEKRPFKSLDQVRAVSELTGPAKGRKPRKLLGDKIVDVCLDMWIGFEAVDRLVKRCEMLGKNLRAAMEPLGLAAEVTGQAGELSSTKLQDAMRPENGSVHDSGIGTPSSSTPNIEDDSEGIYKKSMSHTRRDNAESDSDVEQIRKDLQKPLKRPLRQPTMMSKDITMKDYQLVGLTWLNLLFEQKMSGILADDMGLGKTCQVIAFISHLVETGVTGPHLVFVPGSTLENWLRELRNFSPNLYVEPYYGSQTERAQQRFTIESEIQHINVVVTTYDMAKGRSMIDGNVDAKFLRKLRPVATVYDEGHVLRNRTNKLYDTLIRIPSQFRLLLTGTPLQNNLQELVSLLAFIMPDVFQEQQEDLQNIFKYKAKTVDNDHAGLLSARRINRARSMMTPFVLRRKKHQVLDLPPKIRRVEQCELLPGAHEEIYVSQLEEEKPELEQSTTVKRGPKKRSGAMTGLRLAAIHPLLFRRLYDDDKVRKIIRIAKQNDLVEGKDDRIWESYAKMGDFELHKYCWENSHVLGDFKLKDDEWMDSGKVKKLCELLARFKANGDRTLIFSQFTMVMDILERVLTDLNLSFHRLDGNTAIPDRLAMVDEFGLDNSIPVFMLSTKAGGTGINLPAANKVIIFDSSFNPQDDIQAENRAHRVGQTREVEVVRLITKGTIEEQIYALGESKLTMDERVAGEGTAEGDDGNADAIGAEQVRQMMVENLKRGKKKPIDAKEGFLHGLKDAGLDMSAA
ncbi:MAG: hypothetical protein Q9165_007241 [Trypethelium subeluteriae]